MRKNGLVIIGAGGHGKVVLDSAKLLGYKNIVFLDDLSSNPLVVGKIKDCEKYKEDFDFIVAIGNNEDRKKISKYLSNKGIIQTSIIHPSAIIGSNVKIANGVVVAAGAIINADSILSEGVIVNTSASVDHDSVIGAFTHVAVGARLCGGVNIGNDCIIGAGSVIINGIAVSSNVIVGAGGVVVRSINESGKYVGVPVRKI